MCYNKENAPKRHKEPYTKVKKERYHILDFIRALTLIGMIAYHLLWDLVYLFGVDMPWFRSNWGYAWQQSICYTFIFLSGFCVCLGKRAWLRGLTVTGASIVISLVTYFFMPKQVIKFGVLTLIGVCMIIAYFFDKIGKKIPPYVGLVVCLLLFFFTRNIYKGNLGFEGIKILTLPRELYQNDITAFFGFPHSGFFSTDYFPLFPWMFLFFSGYFLHKIFQKQGWMDILKTSLCPPLQFIGRHSLPIYMAHQAVIYGILLLLFNCIL